jgi:hypothetical protein
MAQYTLIATQHLNAHEDRITLRWSPGLILRALGARAMDQDYVGSGTTWREYPSGEFMGHSMTTIIMRLVAQDRMAKMYAPV